MPGGSLPAATGSRFDRSWRSGDKIHLNGNDYQPHGGVIQAMAPDRSRVSRRVDARQLGDRSAVVALRQVGVLCETESALRRKMAMAREAGLLTEMRGMRGMPRLVATLRESDGVTLVLASAPGRSLREAYRDRPLNHVRTTKFLTVLRGLCIVLAELHQRGLSHRALDMDAVTVSGTEVYLRDLGLAAATAGSPRETDLQRIGSGQRIDVCQVAQIAFFVLKSHLLSIGVPLPSATDPRLPRNLDILLTSALSQHPAERPSSAGELAERLDEILVSISSSRI